jgi:2-methylisocitrate lyase-like PEP mutase family enzyme
MRRYCAEVDGPKMANLIEGGKTPILAPARLREIGYTIAVYPLTLLNASIVAMRTALRSLRNGETPAGIMDFEGLKSAVGFPEYYADEARYKTAAAYEPRRRGGTEDR